MLCCDSGGKVITIGDRVRFRSAEYTIKAFHPKEGRFDTARIEFVEPVPEEVLKVWGQPDEIGVDKV